MNRHNDQLCSCTCEGRREKRTAKELYLIGSELVYIAQRLEHYEGLEQQFQAVGRAGLEIATEWGDKWRIEREADAKAEISDKWARIDERAKAEP